MADKLVLGLTTGNKVFTQDKVMAVSGKDGAATNINDPVDAGYKIAATVDDAVLHAFINDEDDLEILLAKIATNEPTEQYSTCAYTLLKPSNIDIEDWSRAKVEDIVLQYPSGTNVATNPHGLAQVGNKLYIVDYDSQKIVILGNGELKNIAKGAPYTLATPPYDLGPAGEDKLSPSARGQAIIALQNKAGASFLFALYLNYDMGALTDSILVRLTVGSNGIPAFDAQVTVGINAQEIWPVARPVPPEDTAAPNAATDPAPEDMNVLLLIPAIGGTQQAGLTNGTNSKINAIPAFGSWSGISEAKTIVTGDLQASPSTTYSGPLPAKDIRVVVSSLRRDLSAPVYILAAGFTADYRGADYRIYKTTVEDIFTLYASTNPAPAISSLVAPDVGPFAVVKGGQVYSAAEPTLPYGIFYLALLFQSSENEDDERLYEFLGSALTVSSAKHYGARAITFGLGTDPGQIGGDTVNSAILLAETVRQALENRSLKQNATPVKVTIVSVSGEEEEEEEEK
jgi:hypothetical protein